MAGAGLVAGGVYSRGLFGQASCEAVVKTAAGRLRGECLNGCRVFKGVPFAESPVGALRFRAPVRKSAWVGERDATRFAAAPLQTGTKGVELSEDCLYLNVWAPEGKGPFPVFVWIHGGGFTGGHSFEPTFDGSGFAREGVVCVTVAYRLGVFGFVDLEPALGKAYAGSANNGLRDLVAALEWVRGNIAAFGGDPERVTVGGESAGAKLTDILLGVPEAKNLFQQAISESGGAERVWPHATALAIGAGFAEDWKKTGGSLLSAAGDALLPVQRDFIDRWPQHFPMRPEMDGVFLTEMPVKGIARGLVKGKRLLIGTNQDESAAFVGPQPDHDASAAELGNLSQDTFAAVYAKYAALYPELTVEQRRIRALTAEEYWVPSVRLTEAQVAGGGAAWMYRMDFTETKGRLKDYAYHALDTGMVWDRPHVHVGDDEQEAELAHRMHAAWVAFIKTGAPSAAGLPAWPQYDVKERATMILDDRGPGQQSRVERRPHEAELRVWDGVL